MNKKTPPCKGETTNLEQDLASIIIVLENSKVDLKRQGTNITNKACLACPWKHDTLSKLCNEYTKY